MPQNGKTLKTWRIWRWPLHWQILLGLVIGATIGLLLGMWAVASVPASTPAREVSQAAERTVRGTTSWVVLQLIGDLFMRGLKLIVIPLVASSILLAVAGLGAKRDFGRLGIKTLAYYMGTSLIAIVIGLTLVNAFSPGVSADGRGILEGRDLSAFASEQRDVESRTAGKTATDFLNVFRTMVPENMVEAASRGDLLAIVVVAMIGGIILSRIADPGRTAVMNVTRGIYDMSLAAAHLVLAFAPIGVLGLLGDSIAIQYAKLAPDDRFPLFIRGISLFAGIAFAALAIHMFVTYPLLLMILGRVNPWRHFRAMSPALVTAFSTASSSATMPVTLSCVEGRAGVSPRIAGFTIPLGATVNMDGTALYECVAVMFICQAFGIDLSFGQQFLVVLAALLTSVGVAGVPAASLVAIVVILNAVQAQLPPGAPALITGLAMLFVFDRPLDMCRTAVNVFSDSCVAVIVARSEGETGILSNGQTAEVSPEPASR